MTRSSGSEKSLVSRFFNNTKIKVNEPILPNNMLSKIKILPIKLNLAVKPSDKPKTAKAEVASKITLKKSAFTSVINKQKAVNAIQDKLSTMMVMALYTWDCGIVRPPISILLRPEITALVVAKKITSVEVLIPLPVEPGAEPIKQRIKINK